jgi:hypothetical protein
VPDTAAPAIDDLLGIVVASIGKSSDAVANPAECLRVALAILLTALDVVARGGVAPDETVICGAST